ncbi:MAG: hypothetical protein H0T64_08915 [Pyrinomonadaceae bacterium]|nr:hypothetical protein [Pyrinomonadaceae bacterium]MDQ3172872.1 hypothetical protein [Acidobacteriota bacterium]
MAVRVWGWRGRVRKAPNANGARSDIKLSGATKDSASNTPAVGRSLSQEEPALYEHARAVGAGEPDHRIATSERQAFGLAAFGFARTGKRTL